jgi:hypothetical protein
LTAGIFEKSTTSPFGRSEIIPFINPHFKASYAVTCLSSINISEANLNPNYYGNRTVEHPSGD